MCLAQCHPGTMMVYSNEGTFHEVGCVRSLYLNLELEDDDETIITVHVAHLEALETVFPNGQVMERSWLGCWTCRCACHGT